MPDRWQRTEAALEAALQAPFEERSFLLDRICADDRELRDEVDSLLAAHAASEGFLNTSAESFAAPFVSATAARESSDHSGAVIGRYRLIKEIGRGGMGAVWLADRADGQFDQRVALKLIKRGMDSDEILDRFIRERQILARLQHPNIARLVDGGVNEDGRPYFAMEYVSGSAITEWCELRGLTLNDRLRLFIVVARAVGFAHRNLIVHRDIKPSNILVDDSGVIKLLDFGIAKVLDDSVGPNGIATRTSAAPMTTEYASPEQVAGAQVTTASDVYQLGILLYELVTGSRPSGHLKRPSSLTRSREVRGDIDNIVLRALRAEPELRFPSAEDIADDVERHLANKPLRFGGDSASYRARKFVQRHRLAVYSTISGILLLVGFLVFDAARVRRERDRARHEADKATEVSQLMAGFLQGWNPDASDRGEVSASKLLGEAALRADRELADRPEMLAATLSLLGDFHTRLGEWKMADSLLTRAQLVQDRSNAPSAADRAATMVRTGRLYLYTGRFTEAIGVLQPALALHRSIYGSSHPETLRVQHELASAFRDAKRYPEMESALRSILAIAGKATSRRSPFALEVSSDLAYSLFSQARYDEAVDILRPTLAMQRQLFGSVHRSTLYTIRSLGSSLRDRGDLDEAEKYYREALRISRALYGENHVETERALLVLSLALTRKNQLAEAESLSREALTVARKIHGGANVYIWGYLVNVGAIRLDRGDMKGAEQWLREALDASKTDKERNPDAGDVLNRLAWITASRKSRDAPEVYRAAVTFDNSRPRGSADFVSDGIHFLAMTEQMRGDTAAAARTYLRALRIYEKQLPALHPYRVATVRGLNELRK